MLYLALMFFAVSLSIIALPKLYDAGARIRYRLFNPRGQYLDAAVDWDRKVRRVLAAGFFVVGVICVVRAVT